MSGSTYRFDVQRLNDNGLTILNGITNCVPAIGSFDGDMVKVSPNQIILNSGEVGNWGRQGAMYKCTFDLDEKTGQISISMDNKASNPWANKANNMKTYAENTKAFLQDYVLKPIIGGKRKSRVSKAKASIKTRKTRKSSRRH
jgi:hypothetical protein